MAEKILDLDPFILAAEKKQDLPPGLLKQIIDEAGTGIPPKARASILEKFGLDAKLSNANAVEAAGILLSDALANNKGDAGLALAEYRSGKDRAEWGIDTAKFVRRVRSGRGVNMAQVGTPQRGPSTAPATPAPAPAPALPNMSALGASTGATTPVPVDPVQMGTPSVTGSGVDVGKLMQSTGEVQKFEAPPPPPPSRTQVAMVPGMDAIIPAAAGEPEGPHTARPESLASYADGTMPAERRAQMRDLVKSGDLLVPEGFSLEEPGMATRATAAVKGAASAVGEMVTGDKQKTATTEAASDITMSPEWQELQASGLAGPMRGAGVKDTALRVADIATGGLAGGIAQMGRMAASPGEQFQIILANNPNLKPETDEKGNRFFRSANGQVYSEKPGLRLTDAPRLVANAAPFIATGGLATTIPRAMLQGAGTQLGLEAGQAAAGGEVNPGEVILAGALGGATALGGRAVDAAKRVMGVGKEAAAPAAAAAVNVAEDASQATRVPVGKAIDEAELARLFTDASGKGSKASAAQGRLADLAAVDPAAEAAFRRLGIDTPVDLLSNNPQLRSKMGLARSKLGSEAQATFGEAIDDIVKRSDDAIKDLGAVTSNGMASPQAASSDVLKRLTASRDELALASSAAHDAIDEIVPKATEVPIDALREFMDKLATDVGRANLSPAEEKIYAFAMEAHPSYGGLRRQANVVGKALEGKLTDAFSNVDTADLKRLYGAIAQSRGDAVEAIGGKALRKQLEEANKLSVAQFKLQERITEGFGREGTGDLAPRMSAALRGAKGDKAKPLMDLLEIVPEDMHKGVIATALAKETERGGKLAPDLFVKFYDGLRANPDAFKVVREKLGPEATDVMRDVFEVSKRLVDATGKVKHTGIGNQEFEALLGGNGLMARLVDSQLGRNAGRAAGGAVGAVMGGPVGAAAGAGAAGSLIEVLANAKKDILPTVGKLFSSPEFKALAIEMRAGAQPSKETVRKVAASQRWRDFAKAANMPRDPKAGEQFLSAALQAARQTRGEQ